jgi:hypothetical protein
VGCLIGPGWFRGRGASPVDELMRTTPHGGATNHADASQRRRCKHQGNPGRDRHLGNLRPRLAGRRQGQVGSEAGAQAAANSTTVQRSCTSTQLDWTHFPNPCKRRRPDPLDPTICVLLIGDAPEQLRGAARCAPGLDAVQCNAGQLPAAALTCVPRSSKTWPPAPCSRSRCSTQHAPPQPPPRAQHGGGPGLALECLLPAV